MTITPTQITTAIQRAAAIGDAIKSLGEVPAGHLYAGVMAHMTLGEFDAIIAVLKKADLISESNHLIKWIGPDK